MQTPDTAESLELREFVDEIAGKIESLTPADILSQGYPLPFEAAVLIKLDLGIISQRLAEIVGRELVDEFFRDYEPRDFDGTRHLGLPLAQLIPDCCESSGVKILVDKDTLYARLADIAEAVREGVAHYSICLRLANLDIDKDFELDDGIHFRKIPREEVLRKYSVDRRQTALSLMSEERLVDHRVEVVIAGSAKPADLQRRLRIEESGALVNSITHPFILADIPHQNPPCVTHVLVTSPVEGRIIHKGVGGFSYTPPLLTAENVDTIRKTYAFLQTAQADRVLRVAIDRFIVGKKQGNHHVNRINQPNWDKLVDYVIALESLLLTVEDRAVTQELSYRFRLNGASLLRECGERDVQTTFHALKHLYDIRSRVVHGSDDVDILKTAKKLIELLDIDRPDYQHALGRLIIVSDQVETWLRKVLFYLGSLAAADRPYRKKDGWEQLVWQATAMP